MAQSDLVSLLGALGVGGLFGTGTTLWIQGRRERMKATIALIDGFSTLEAHKLRRQFWNTVHNPEIKLASFDDVGNVPDENDRFAVLYVISFFTTAGSLMIEGALVNPVFFRLAERWFSEILEKHLIAMGHNTDPSGPYRVHTHAIRSLYERWWNMHPSPRYRARPISPNGG
ncbi:hypothetical protein E5673_08370 [Sphingomonas sp. PAMC26645]|uniref:hypothetical protein n=1 Tax=Sphingomonas sp. PAMC26645 TaxID=2565555 RepID=UPI00109E1ACD|nr:hypothetical protein [Sphingomonas sp. PAMC26645]QCB42246.1 hypothetical protein E5673_08370 [Sphingomonas sp. PAMC26645]